MLVTCTLATGIMAYCPRNTCADFLTHPQPFPHFSTMKRLLTGSLALVAFAAYAGSDYPVQPVPFTAVRLTGGLLHDRQATNSAVTLPFALDQCESSGRLRNFDLPAQVIRRR